MYAIDWVVYLNQNLSVFLRQVRTMAVLNAFLSPVKFLHGQFLAWADSQRTSLLVTGQVRVLRYWLNKYYDPILKGVTITDVASSDQIFIFSESENLPVYLPVFISGQQVHFTVTMPNNYNDIDGSVQAFLKKYKLPTKRYQIVYGLQYM